MRPELGMRPELDEYDTRRAELARFIIRTWDGDPVIVAHARDLSVKKRRQGELER